MASSAEMRRARSTRRPISSVSLATLAMVLVIYLGGWSSDRFGLVATAVGLFITLMLGVLAVELKSLQQRRLGILTQTGMKS